MTTLPLTTIVVLLIWSVVQCFNKVDGVKRENTSCNTRCKTSSKGTEYRGTMQRTASGIICQAWISQTPHHHTSPSMWPKAGLEKNYCRNPDHESGGPWCYTMDSTKRWEYCPVPLCPGCKATSRGTEYRGHVSTTISGRTCQAWTSQTPHHHTPPSMWPKAGLEKNYCRNPDHEDNGPWCYTMDTNKRWEYCPVLSCSDPSISATCGIDPCLSTPCQNGGVCAKSGTAFTCNCRQGYTGRLCDKMIDNCNSQPCKYGSTCINKINGYNCICLKGLTGMNCQNNINECLEQEGPCFGRGKCIDEVGGFRCLCINGFAGARCNYYINNGTCSTNNPCQNNAPCEDVKGGVICKCPAGIFGRFCQLNPGSKPIITDYEPKAKKIVKVAETIVFECFYSATPTPTATWKKVSGGTTTGIVTDIYNVHKEKVGVAFAIFGSTIADTGIYECSVTNKMGHDTRRVELEVN